MKTGKVLAIQMEHLLFSAHLLNSTNFGYLILINMLKE